MKYDKVFNFLKDKKLVEWNKEFWKELFEKAGF